MFGIFKSSYDRTVTATGDFIGQMMGRLGQRIPRSVPRGQCLVTLSAVVLSV
jgi:hypothetical protein